MFLKKTFVFILLAASSRTDAQSCQNGAQCVELQQCTNLYTQLQDGTSPQLTALLRSLHCGFNNNMPKICCPPEFSGHAVSSFSRNGGDSVNPLSLLPSLSQCGAQNDDRIVGGTRADIDEHPWMALLRYDKLLVNRRLGATTNGAAREELRRRLGSIATNNARTDLMHVVIILPSHFNSARGWGFYCGGVLISSKYVLTAAHCVKGEDLPKNWRLSQVRLGEWNTTSAVDCVETDCSGPPQDVPVERVIPHENYDPADIHQANDIALLRLEHNVVFNDFVKPICLPTSTEVRRTSLEGYDMEVAGWGKTETRSESDVKLKVVVPVVSNSQCGNVFSRVSRTITQRQLCAGGVSGQDSCRGDSGGPLMGKISSHNNWFVFGVVSYGPSPCGTQGWPGVYTRVTEYTDWILSKLKP